MRSLQSEDDIAYLRLSFWQSSLSDGYRGVGMRRVPTVTMRIAEGQHGGLRGRVAAGGFPARAIHSRACGIRMGRKVDPI